MEEPNEIVISRTFDAPRELVWKAWTDPELVKKWWGPEGFTAPSIKIDLRVCGKYIFAMHGPPGSQWDKDMYSAGEYEKIIPKEKLVVTDYFSDEQGNMITPQESGLEDPNFPKESIYTVSFEQIEKGKTKLSIIYPIPKTKEQREAVLKSGMIEGWNSSLNKLAELMKKA